MNMLGLLLLLFVFCLFLLLWMFKLIFASIFVFEVFHFGYFGQ